MSRVSHDILGELARGQLGAKRLRLAVTAEEYEAIRQECLAGSGYFAARLWGIPLVIDAAPLDAALSYELGEVQ